MLTGRGLTKMWLCGNIKVVKKKFTRQSEARSFGFHNRIPSNETNLVVVQRELMWLLREDKCQLKSWMRK